jgi:hypothetical protein
MTRRCPRCAAELPEDAVWVCPSCDYTLRTPAVSKVGILFMFLGLVLVGGYVMGPQSIGLTSGIVPTDLANLMVTYFVELIVGTFGLGMLLMAAGAMFVRAERNKVAAGA